MSELDRFRKAVPGFENADDREVVREIAKRTNQPFEQLADTFGVPTRGFGRELVSQVGAGFAVDAPDIAGGALQYFGSREQAPTGKFDRGLAPASGLERRLRGQPEPEPSLAFRAGTALREGARERAPDWEPDMRGRGEVAQTFLKAGRGVGPVLAGLAPALLPGGAAVSATVMPAAFAGSAAQDTYENLIAQGIPADQAAEAARGVFGLNYAGETVGTVATLGLGRALAPAFRGARTPADVARRMTDTRVLVPTVGAIAANVPIQMGTEAFQDVGSAMVEQAYGGQTAPLGDIAYESATVGGAMAILLGPLSFGNARARARRSEEFKQALYNPQTDPQVRAQAMDAVIAEARRQNVDPKNIDAWFEQQLEMEDARTAAMVEAEERAAAEAQANRDKTLAQMVSEEGLTAQLSDQDLLTPGRTSAQAINQAVGLTRKKVDPKKYVKGFESAFNEPSGQFGADPETGIERELTVGELYQMQNGVLDMTQDNPAQTAVAEAAATETLRDPRAMFMRDTLGIVPNQYSMQLLDAIEQAGIPLDSDMVSPVITFAANGTLGKKGLTRALQMLDEAVINSRRAAAPVVSEVPGVSESAGVSPTAAPAVVGLSQGGQVAPTTTQAPVAPAAAPVAPTAAAQIGQAPSAPATPAPVIQEGTPSGITTPQAQQTETQGQEAATPAAVSAAAAWDRFSPDGAPAFNELAPALQQAWTRAAQQGETSWVLAEQVADANRDDSAAGVDPRVELIAQLFDGKNATRNAEMFIDRVVMGMSLENLGKKYGLSTSAVGKIVGGEKDAAARMQASMARAQARGVNVESVQEALRGLATEAQERGELDIQNMFGDVDATSAEAAQADLGTRASSVGGSGANTAARLDAKEKRTFEILEALATERSPQKRAELEAELTAITQAAREVERRTQEVIRANAKKSGKEDEAAWEQEGRDVVDELGAEDAVQEQGAAGVPVQPEAEAGQKVGRQVRRAEKPAAEGQAKTEAKVLTTQERYAEVTAGIPGAPAFDSLTKAQQDQLADLNNGGNLNLAAVNTLLAGGKFGMDAPARNPYTAKELLAEIKAFIRADVPGRKLLVVDSIQDLLNSPDRDVQIAGAGIALNQAYGVAVNGRAYLIANRINKGAGRAKFMHEVGAHLGLENLLTKKSYDKLTQQILDWAKKDDGSTESQLAKNAAARVMSAGTPKEDQRSELLAYFIEEAMESGIDPTAVGKESGPLREWFRTLWAAFKTAARALGVKPESMTSQDVVNLAFGAARLEIAGTWHGTAAAFRNFSNKFMGTGEGAQAFGWGTYLAQRAGIAKGYWKADVKRKTTKRKLKQDAETFNRAVKWSVDELMSDGIFDTIEEVERFANIMEEASGKPMPEWAYSAGKIPEGSLMRVDVSVPENEMLDWDTPLSEQPSVLAKVEANLSEDLRQAVEEEVNESLDAMTGEDFYRALTFIEKRNGFVSEQFDVEDYNKRLANTPAKQVVSTFIDEKLGINGLKFLDANSRGSTGELAVVGRRLATSKKYLNELTSDEFEKVDPATDLEMTPAQVQKAIADTQETIKQLESEVARLKSAETRNIVVFDDKNIFRVGAQAGADRQRMKFGKNATEGVNQATRAQPRGTVLNNINRLPKRVQQPANIIAGTLSDTGGKFLDKVMFTSDLVKRATNLGLKSADNLLRSLAARDFATREEERAIEAVLDLYADVPQTERGTGNGSVNRFIFDSTRTGKWGYGPKADPEMKARFDALSPQAKKLVEAMFTHGDRMLARKKSVVLDNTTSVFDAQIAAAKTDKEKAELRTAKKLSLKRYESLFAITEGRPYAPIKRNGNYVVIAKSPKYLAAEATGDTKAIEKLQASGDDYHVSFVDGKNAGRTLMQQLQDQGGFGDVQLAERDAVTDELFSNEGALQQLSKLRTNVDSRVKAGEKESGPLLNIINQMYLDALAEGSARKSEMKRRGVDGEVDMIASFGTQGRADANFLASLQYSEQVSRDLNRMREEAKTGDRTRKSEVLNELVRRYSDSLEVPNTPILDKLTRMSSVYFLATSPAYYLQNLTQPFMMSVPAMAGEHNYAKVNAELFKAYGELAPMMKSASLMKQLDFTKVPDDVKNAINQLVNRGRVDIGLDTELGEFKVDGESRFGAAWNSVDKGLRAAVQKGEAINRLSTAIAAYRLAMSKKGATAEDAINYAERILLETHGDYSRFNAPRVFNTSFGRIALQFRKFQLIQLTWYAKMIKQAYSDPAQRGAALRALTFGVAHTGVLAGAMGLPGYAAFAWAVGSLFGDDDEAFDLTDEIRKLIGDDDLANMILRGVPTLGGADVSGKIGAGNMLSIMPFSNADLTTRAGFYEGLGTLVAGASGGMVVRGVDGLGLLANGDYLKGMELVLPKGLGDMIKAYRLETEGATRRNNDVILPADELSSLEVLWQAIGVPPAQISAMYEKQQRVRDVEQRFTDRTSRIKNDYSQAIRKGDSAAAAEARAAWMKLQEARVRAGLKRQPLSNLLKAPREQQKRERETAGGVQFTRASRGMVEDIVER
jgi:hypothetical protein